MGGGVGGGGRVREKGRKMQKIAKMCDLVTETESSGFTTFFLININDSYLVFIKDSHILI